MRVKITISFSDPEDPEALFNHYGNTRNPWGEPAGFVDDGPLCPDA